MCSAYSNPDFDEIFENEVNDISSDILGENNLLWQDDLLNLNSDEFNFDPLNDETVYDNAIEKPKCKQLDFDCPLADFNELLKDDSECQIKIEPTNSVSSTYMTDESSHNSSINSSPVSNKVRKRSHATLDSSNNFCFPVRDDLQHVPLKTTKVELLKTSMPTKVYKLTKDIKSEPIYINSVTIRQGGSSSAPYVVHTLPGGVRTVNIRPQKYKLPDSRLSYSPQPSLQENEYEEDYHATDVYEHKMDSYAEYKSRANGGFFTGVSQSHINKTLFQPIPQSGPLFLTEEEKRTLLAEGYPIPSRLPLTKQDERNLKKVRRKIKNKISAQESRRKKKEYLDALEKKMDSYEHERIESKRRIELLENTQRSLYSQIRHLQQQLMNKVTGPGNTTSTGLMLFMVCFALLLVGGSLPSSYREMNLPQSRLVSSSSLYSMGYGVSRTVFNYSQQEALFRDSARFKFDKQPPQSPENRWIMPRQSILLGDDGDDRNFEELLLSYRRDRKVCGLGNRHRAHKNGSAVARDSGDDDGALIGLVTNISLIK